MEDKSAPQEGPREGAAPASPGAGPNSPLQAAKRDLRLVARRRRAVAACLSTAGFQDLRARGRRRDGGDRPTPPRDESKRTRRLPPMRFRPQPPAVDDSRKQKWSRPAWTSPFAPSSRRGRGDDVAPTLMSTRVPARRVVEAVRELLALLGRRAAVQQAPWPALADAQPRHQGQGLRLRRDDDAPLVRGRPELPPARGGVPRDHRGIIVARVPATAGTGRGAWRTGAPP